MVLVHDDGDVWIHLDSRFDEVTQEWLTSVLTRASGTLHDHGAVSLISRFHDRFDLFQVVHVERGQAIAMLSSVIEKLT
jgi:hypothetical protein